MRTYEHRMTGELDYAVWYVSDECTKQVNADKPDYLAWLSEGNTPAVIPFVPPILPTQEEINAEICRQSIYKKLNIRRAMRELGLESVLNTFLQNEQFKTDWDDATEINLDDAMVQSALQSASLDVNQIKLKIYEMNTR